VPGGSGFDQLVSVCADPVGRAGAAFDDVDEDHDEVRRAGDQVLLAKALEGKVLKTNRVRADTTVVEANVAYPTDSSLLAKGISRIASAAKKLWGLGYATRTRLVDRTRSAHKRARSINANLRRRNDDKLAEVKRINGELARLAERVVREANRVVRNARRRLRAQDETASGRARALTDRVEQLAECTAKVVDQCRQRLAGTTPEGATRVVSLHDPDARPIAKGRLGKPVEFGYKAQIVDNEDGVILDHNIERGNPPDAPMLEPAIQRITRRSGRAPRAVTADRGYGEQAVEDALHTIGVRYVVLPRKGRPTAARHEIEQRRAFREMVRWRTGCEGRISCAKRDFGLARTRIDGLHGARTWCGHGIFAHNLIKIAGLLE
jgi:transposase, IS5 family